MVPLGGLTHHKTSIHRRQLVNQTAHGGTVPETKAGRWEPISICELNIPDEGISKVFDPWKGTSTVQQRSDSPDAVCQASVKNEIKQLSWV